MKIYCCGCKRVVEARLTYGNEVYPSHKHLHLHPFWKCDHCQNFVGCHHKTADKTKPLGVIATAEIKKARSRIHRKLDPLWKKGLISRKQLYARLSEELGGEYHTANVCSVLESMKVLNALQKIESEL